MLLSRFEALDVPLYLHPAPPPAAVRSAFYDGLAAPVARRSPPTLGLARRGGAAHAAARRLGRLRRHPGLRLIIGHCGEMIPFMLDRVDDMMPPAVTGLTRRYRNTSSGTYG